MKLEYGEIEIGRLSGIVESESYEFSRVAAYNNVGALYLDKLKGLGAKQIRNLSIEIDTVSNYLIFVFQCQYYNESWQEDCDIYGFSQQIQDVKPVFRKSETKFKKRKFGDREFVFLPGSEQSSITLSVLDPENQDERKKIQITGLQSLLHD